LSGRLDRLLEQVPSGSVALAWLAAVVAGVVGFAASLLTVAGTVGWVEAALAVAVLILVLLLCLALVSRHRLEHELSSGRYEALRLANELEHMSKDVGLPEAVLRERVRLLEQEREPYEAALFGIAIRSQRPVAQSVRVVSNWRHALR
jgi:hypothetical protein